MDGLARRFVGEGHDVTVAAPWPDAPSAPTTLSTPTTFIATLPILRG